MSNLILFYVIGLVIGVIATYFLIKNAVQHGVEAALSNKTMVIPENKTDPVVSETSESTEQKFTETGSNQINIIVGVAILIIVLAITAS